MNQSTDNLRRSSRSRQTPRSFYDDNDNMKSESSERNVLRISRDMNKYKSQLVSSVTLKIFRKSKNLKTDTLLPKSANKDKIKMSPTKEKENIATLKKKAARVKPKRKSQTVLSEDDDDTSITITPKISKKSRNSKPIQASHKKPSKLNKQTNKRKILTNDNSIDAALRRLHSSSVPNSLPCRESQFEDIYGFVEQKLIEGEGGCMYISGVPGTGKTATLYDVKRKLEESNDLPSFKFIEINGLRIGDPNQFYVHFLMELTGEKRSNFQATDILNDIFTNGNAKKEFVVLLVDELDFLRTKKQNIFYHIFDWPTRKNSKLIVLAIANAMDLPERLLLNRVSSRLGLTRLSFQPYNFKELEQIVRSRLKDMDGPDVFEPDALQLICRKVAAVSGDARRALDICRRSVEICITDGNTLVTMSDVDKALQEIFNSIKISRIRFASIQEQIFLRSLIQDFRMSGLEESRFVDIYRNHIEICRFEGHYIPTTTELSKVATNLDLSKIILFEKSSSHLYRRIRLNISSNDITFALNLADD